MIDGSAFNYLHIHLYRVLSDTKFDSKQIMVVCHENITIAVHALFSIMTEFFSSPESMVHVYHGYQKIELWISSQIFIDLAVKNFLDKC